MKFTDAYPFFNGNQGYIATNEEIQLHRKLLSGVKGIKKAGSICSGGEVPLLVFLARGIETIAVDHSYHALTAAISKIELLKQYGPVKTRRFLYEEDQAQIHDRFKSVKDKLPGVLQPIVGNLTYNSYDSGCVSFPDVRRAWAYASLLSVKRAVANLDKLSLIHGDLEDLSRHGPFDCLYVSNALSHTGRNGKSPDAKLVNSLVKPGGYVLGTSLSGIYKLSKDWKLIKEINGCYTQWVHSLYQVSGVITPDGAQARAA